MKIKIIGLFLIIIVSVCSVGQVQANDGLQARMEKVYLQHQSKKLLKQQIKASDKDSDLHKTSINIARQQAAVSIHESIQQIITEFKSSAPNCALSYDDAAVLLVKQKGFKRFLNRMQDFDSDFKYKLDDSSFVTACIRYLNCRNAVPKLGNILNTDEYQQCVGDIGDKFTRYMGASLEHNTIGTYSYGDEVFDNGTLEDSAFDIMYDIEQINKLMFANPKRIPSYYLRGPPNYLSVLPVTSYQLPVAGNVNNTGNRKQETGNLKLVPVKLFAANVVLPSVEQAIKQIEYAQQQEESNITSNLQCFDPQPIIQSDPAKEFKKEIAKLQKTVLTLQEEQLLDDVIGTVSQPYDDVAPQPTPVSLPSEIFAILGDDSGDEEVEDRGGNPPSDGSSPGGSQGGGGNTGNNITTEDQCPSATTDIAGQFDLQSDKPKIKECLQKCNSCSAGFFAKKACYTQCLCSKFGNDEQFAGGLGGTTFGMKLCLVPSITPDIITPGTQILSIQEIINQISATIGKLKESGQYIPSSKPSEFFSPTTKIGKLGNLLNFTLNITSRSKYRKPDKNVEQEKTVNYFNTQTPNIAQLQIKHLVGQQSRYADFLQSHLDFWAQMNTVFTERNAAMEQFEDTQKGATKK